MKMHDPPHPGEILMEAIRARVPGLQAWEAARLPPRQREVLGLLAEGRTNKEIARRLGISPATVKIHVARLTAWLGAINRTDAVAREAVFDLEIEASPSGDAVGESGEPSNFTDVAKSPYRSGSAEGTVPVCGEQGAGEQPGGGDVVGAGARPGH